MKKRFILLIDFSEYSGHLLKYAYEWSRQVNAELLLVHQTIVLVPGFTDTTTKEKITQKTNDEALVKLKGLANSILPSLDKVSFSVSENKLTSTLSRLLAEPLDQLIFAGLKGTGLLKKIFLGSVAIQVIEHTDNIVVAMPEDISRFSHQKIFVAVTEKHPLNILGLNNFLNFLDKESTSITFFYLAKPYEETKVINNKIDELLIVQRGSRLLTDQFFRKFLINELVYEGQTPLIVLP